MGTQRNIQPMGRRTFSMAILSLLGGVAAVEATQLDTDRAPYWNNYRLIRADDWRTAFRRAIEMGENSARVGVEAFGGHQEFLGVSDLLPIYDEFEDGAELFWQELWPDADNPNDAPLGVFSEAEMESEYENQEAEAVAPNGS